MPAENAETNGAVVAEEASELDEEASGLISEVITNDAVDDAADEESDDEDVNVDSTHSR